MPKRGKRDTFKLAQVSRVHPDSQHPEYHHRHHHEHRTIQLPIARGKNYVDDYELESISRVEDRLPVSSVLEIRAESPPIKIVQLSSDIHSSELAIDHLGGSSSLVPVEKKSWTQPLVRSFVVSSNSHLLREVSRLPRQTMAMKDIVIQKPASSQKQQLVTVNIKASTVVSVALGLIFAISLGIIIVLSMLLAQKDKQPSFASNSFVSSACAFSCIMSLPSSLISTIASWPFDGSLSDTNNIYLASYSDPPNVPYVTGNIGQAVNFNGAQYVQGSTQFMNLSYQSWTIEAWLWINDLTSERGIFGQCESASITDKCLSLSIKNQRLHLSFHNNDLDGTTVLTWPSTIWHHVVFVYDYTLMQQSIYLDGVLEATSGTSGISVDPYKGTSGAVTIGWITGGYYFNGYIDQIVVSGGVKTACQIFNDATLTAYYAFDVGASYLDSSSNAIHGSAISLITISGRVNQAYSFQYGYAYFQSLAFTAYSSAEPFSVSLWVKPFYTNDGTLIHLSSDNTGSLNCFDLLGFSSVGQLVGQLIQSSSSIKSIGGPTIQVNVWTHIVLTYSSNNGLALYTNGTLQGMTDPFSSFTSSYYSSQIYMTLGNPRTNGSIPTCALGSPAVSATAYRGYIDELRIYSRELQITEICSLFNP